jgi:dTDP-4-dehydrorhamnose reductase
MTRVIITGASGQLGQSFYQVLGEQGFNIIDIPDWPEFDVSDHSAVQMLSGLYPELIIHCGAMTDVDACAKDPDTAFKVNAFGTQNVAHACLRCNAEMVYISTNEVFSGRADRPYLEADKPQPVNPYGSSKRAGEQMASNYLRDGLYVVRTAWLYGGGHMFPEKIVAAAEKNGELRVVTDEVSSPTYRDDLVEAVLQLIRSRQYGLYHFTNSGYCSRYEFAQEVLRLSGREDIPIHPITLAEYPRPSVVPRFTPLTNSLGAELGITLRPWQQALAEHIKNSK